MSLSDAPRGPYKLVTVNTAPERARRLVGEMIQALNDRFDIIHVANCESIAEVEKAVSEYDPHVLFCASMWTSEEATEIQTIARTAKPDLATYAIPHGLKVQEGENAIVDHLKCMVPQILELSFGSKPET